MTTLELHEVASPFPMDREALDALMASALTRRAHEGARVVALHWLRELTTARDEWRAASDPSNHAVDRDGTRQAAQESLHRARVALRRLRSTIREHRSSLDLNEGDRQRQRLRRLNKATGELRDADVQSSWLEAERDNLDEHARDQADELLRDIRSDSVDEAENVSRAFSRCLDGHVEQLVDRLRHYRLPQAVGEADVAIPFAHHLADRIDRGALQLQRDLALVDDASSQDVLHRIRIRLKRQRAMLAPFAKSHASLGAWYALATQGQDFLGAMRDASLLSARAKENDYTELASSAQAASLAHFEAFHAQWCADTDAILEACALASKALRSMSANANVDLRDHGLPMEIERKFLLHGLPPNAAMAPSIRIEQGWLPGTTLRERLRRTTASNGVVQCTRTVKLGAIGSRIEIEEPTDPALFASLWPLTVNARIRKRRHIVHEGALTWEIDVFLDRDLVLAEVELQDALPAVTNDLPIPTWLQPFIVREVTQEPAYLNSVMARRDVASPEHSAS